MNNEKWKESCAYEVLLHRRETVKFHGSRIRTSMEYEMKMSRSTHECRRQTKNMTFILIFTVRYKNCAINRGRGYFAVFLVCISEQVTVNWAHFHRDIQNARTRNENDTCTTTFKRRKREKEGWERLSKNLATFTSNVTDMGAFWMACSIHLRQVWATEWARTIRKIMTRINLLYN